MTSGNEYIHVIQQLKWQPRNNEALLLLQKVASMVKPVMKKHGFKVGKLVEFFPKDGRLLGLNVNHGMKVCLRLRPSHNNDAFYPLESLIGTMLHELTHNRHGPHDAKFYKFLDSITKELEALIAQGFKGDGVFSPGHSLGGSRTVSRAELTKLAAAAAEKRRVLYSGSGKMLGGAAGDRNLTVQEQVRRAWIRKQEDEKWCGEEREINRDDLGIDDDVVIVKERSLGNVTGEIEGVIKDKVKKLTHTRAHDEEVTELPALKKINGKTQHFIDLTDV